ncbi:SDR family oxidoreductase [Devosia psychrophila]|uniref:NAD(P)-dependent dehydrogenase, short-chain alcohol dehydrogenase family n=1 Tax=Devosia psychrophila TaxID=728005 RepID=A0A0F5PY86_9HYPH|nr:SDR family oxidoreductase [Devosia psychrophila]KKC32794.1 short-chain dehydrogenase [Devosia psychrophila]SFD21073.1 NAD(P)-dependent dehydrogenase, short-chain alcohol dehydrogenase family [Devosia psychrophila]
MTTPFGQSLLGKAVLITGGFQGLGLEIARHAKANGASRIVLAGRDKGKAERARAEIAGAELVFGELSDPKVPARLMAEALAGGPLDGLVNAAGITDRASFLDGTPALWDKLFAVNARAPFLLMSGLITHLRARGAPGSIVNIQSMNAHCGAADLAIYSASKGALQTLTRNAANAHVADRIRVNGINMGWAATEGEQQMQARTLGKGESWAETAGAVRPLGRLLEASEVARLAIYLLSDLSGLQTGTSTDLEQWVVGAPP